MNGVMLVLYLVFAASLARALLVQGRVLPPTCARCGLPFERQELGGRVCGCGHHDR